VNDGRTFVRAGLQFSTCRRYMIRATQLTHGQTHAHNTDRQLLTAYTQSAELKIIVHYIKFV